MNPEWRAALLVVLFAVWFIPFVVFFPKNRGKAVRKDTRARWGIALQIIAMQAVLLHSPATWARPLAVWRAAAGTAFGLAAGLLTWTAVLHLGKQWRVDAGLNADHELVQTGPYSFVRHPIYASMVCVLLMGVALAGTLPGWPIGVALFVVGIEIRVRAEDALLLERFGPRFAAWQKAVPAYIPLLR